MLYFALGLRYIHLEKNFRSEKIMNACYMMVKTTGLIKWYRISMAWGKEFDNFYPSFGCHFLYFTKCVKMVGEVLSKKPRFPWRNKRKEREYMHFITIWKMQIFIFSTIRADLDSVTVKTKSRLKSSKAVLKLLSRLRGFRRKSFQLEYMSKREEKEAEYCKTLKFGNTCN